MYDISIFPLSCLCNIKNIKYTKVVFPLSCLCNITNIKYTEAV